MANHHNFFNTDEIHDRTQSQLQHSKELQNELTVANTSLGITLVDFDKSKHIRVKSYLDTVGSGEDQDTASNSPVVCHLDTWGDSIMYSAECTWFSAFNDHDIQSGTASINPCGEYISVGIDFEREYATIPKVVCWLRALHLGMAGDWRIDVTPIDITTKGCKLNFRVWGTTQAHWIEASWIAYSSDRSDVESGEFSTMEQREWTIPQHNHEKKVTFSKNFEHPPVVYLAINRIDETNDGNLRVKAYVQDVTAQGMSVHLDSWGDTVMYTTVGQWIALQHR
ncbi:hypothetical protein RSOLAG1IB_07207 [Rhizoctonia solani AG-1 IB]|uniref:H-type lectin domain-containing protein n=1 Tax=Thanatephorus cucumeris (strain AG1-IB / isolate 7/3/14) TaxID=1108050 RepID=A0A0B7FEQ8_THACB|nr:hypothetical protein RSOLAG1IB_07207 [Rhizoctonia solani AG-1 IB]